ncbi:DnaA regulatory inactivator Hda [Thiohalobacter sp.]|uniref:DnaA regulatory inactivator Hda n=1 Tax=Thiohalobacter sp. TaxID=2025948 RepID=UPI0026106686|nr:DnaA regulatory inactivator Hda [Thiohalobacter sp.]
MVRQLPLGIRLADAARLDNFVAGPNAEAVAAVRSLVDSPAPASLLLAGAPGSGRTHLLQAACRHAGEAGLATAYLPLEMAGGRIAEALAGLEALELVVLDDIDVLAGKAAGERALFNLFNELRAAGGRLLASASDRPERLGFRLPDLVSRLNWGLFYALRPLDDAARMQVLKRRAAERGLELGDEVCGYLLKRCPRDLPALMALLERIDRDSLARQRRITIPFLRETLRL